MKIYKNHFVIFILALTFLFFASCGKKKSDDEIKLPPETKRISKKVVKKPPQKKSKKSKSSFNLKKSEGVLIIAELISENKITPQNLFAEIKNKNKFPALSIVSSTNYNDGQITFPKIKKGLTNLQIVVKADNIAETTSDFFDTLNGKNKTIKIKIEQGVVWRGNVKYADGSPVTNFYLRATPRGLYENQKNIGHINKNIIADKDGDFKITGLLNEYYKIQLLAENAGPIVTNVYFCNQINFINFVFPVVEFFNLHGIVLYEKNNEPAEKIKIIFTCQPEKKIKVVTNIKGEFKIKIPKGKYYNEQLKIDEPGFAVVKRAVNFTYANKKIILYLRKVGAVEGKITAPDKKPISGIKVKLLPTYRNLIVKKSRFTDSQSQWNNREAYAVEASEFSDESGSYSISRVAAPESYNIEINSDVYFLPTTKPIVVKVMPGKTTKCDITLLAKPVVMLKFLEKSGEPILNYSLNAESKSANSSYEFGSDINLSKNEEWGRVELGMIDKNAMLSLMAKSKDGKIGETNNILISSGKTNFIVLTANNTPKMSVSGFIYDYQTKPIIDKQIMGYCHSGGVTAKSDHLGYFELKNLAVKKNENIKLSLWYFETRYETNVVAGANDIEWMLPEPKAIIGRVCLGNDECPVTNFAVGLNFVVNCKSFKSNNGTFKIFVNTSSGGKWKTGKVVARIDGYSPKSVNFNFNKESVCDVGNIIIKEKPGTIKGRVIDDLYEPMSVEVGLLKKYGNNFHQILTVNSCPKDGTFIFENVPLENFTVVAYSRIRSVESKPFELKSGEIKIIPDLIIVTTNSTVVNFNFLLPDGEPAENAEVKYFNKSTDENGELTERIRFGIYENLEVDLNGQTYYSEKFVINKDTARITVQLKSSSKIIGTATFDDKPLNNMRLDFKLNKHYYATVFNGKFEFNGPEGLYSVFCRKKKCVSEIKLTKNGSNTIKFQKGTGTFDIEFPKENWNAYLILKFGEAFFQIDNIDGNAKMKNAKSTNLPAGEYKIIAHYYDDKTSSNITVNTILKSGETKKIKF